MTEFADSLVPTPHGDARVHVARPADQPRGLMMLGPEKSRLPELTSVTAPTLVVQGDRDPFGIPDAASLPGNITLVVVSGDHSLKKDAPAIRAAIADWLSAVA